MDYLIKIQENYSQRQRLEKVITDLLYFIEAGSVYISCYDKEDMPTIITFILKKNCGQDGDTLGETVHKLIKLYPDFVFKFINSNWATYGFRKGKPFFIQHCTIKELVYFEPDNKIFYPHIDASKELLKKAKKRFYKDQEAAVVTFRTVSIYTRNNKNVEAAFAMHQSLRYIYICASEFLTSEYIGSTCLLEQYDWVIDFAPSLKNILSKDVEADKEILILLNTAYSCTQYNYSMEAIESGLIDTAKTKIELMQKEVCRLFLEFTKTCKEKIKELSNQAFLGQSIFMNKIHSNYFIDKALFKISNLIAAFFRTRAIYCFGYTTTHNQDLAGNNGYYSKQLPDYHFYLLVLNIEHKENAVSLLQSLICDKFEGKYRVTILNHRANYLRKQNQNQKYFFDTVTTNGLLIYNNPFHPIYCKTFGAVRDLEFSKNYWQNRILAARQFFDLVQNCSSNDSALIKNALLHQAVEQILVGIVDLFLSYHPNKLSFNYLFSLMEYIPEVEFPFDFTIEREKELYQLLSANIEMLKHKDIQCGTIEYSMLLEEKCIEFFRNAKGAAEKEIKRLENLNLDTYGNK
ncbi:hypothetical protein ACM55H_17460 [Flavobacterium sp. ZT3R17]|uniref:hypothetical protein n=1 Tax=Flavobacterium cryoconiti TaxID=3398736 RepID=UPI003A863A14